ncbi:hypothetical protein HDU76_003552 [Blyttiomyces sp. JEL0837]|nr:hypothetical protein HDU76_003552 [Blyttiomyces sp. JEL0837]
MDPDNALSHHHPIPNLDSDWQDEEDDHNDNHHHHQQYQHWDIDIDIDDRDYQLHPSLLTHPNLGPPTQSNLTTTTPSNTQARILQRPPPQINTTIATTQPELDDFDGFFSQDEAGEDTITASSQLEVVASTLNSPIQKSSSSDGRILLNVEDVVDDKFEGQTYRHQNVVRIQESESEDEGGIGRGGAFGKSGYRPIIGGGHDDDDNVHNVGNARKGHAERLRRGSLSLGLGGIERADSPMSNFSGVDDRMHVDFKDGKVVDQENFGNEYAKSLPSVGDDETHRRDSGQPVGSDIDNIQQQQDQERYSPIDTADDPFTNIDDQKDTVSTTPPPPASLPPSLNPPHHQKPTVSHKRPKFTITMIPRLSSTPYISISSRPPTNLNYQTCFLCGNQSHPPADPRCKIEESVKFDSVVRKRVLDDLGMLRGEVDGFNIGKKGSGDGMGGREQESWDRYMGNVVRMRFLEKVLRRAGVEFGGGAGVGVGVVTNVEDAEDGEGERNRKRVKR